MDAQAFPTTAVRVCYSYGTFTARGGGKAASCTWSPSEATRLLADKLGYTPSAAIERVGEAEDGNGEFWKIVEVGPCRPST